MAQSDFVICKETVVSVAIFDC